MFYWNFQQNNITKKLWALIEIHTNELIKFTIRAKADKIARFVCGNIWKMIKSLLMAIFFFTTIFDRKRQKNERMAPTICLYYHILYTRRDIVILNFYLFCDFSFVAIFRKYFWQAFRICLVDERSVERLLTNVDRYSENASICSHRGQFLFTNLLSDYCCTCLNLCDSDWLLTICYRKLSGLYRDCKILFNLAHLGMCYLCV